MANIKPTPESMMDIGSAMKFLRIYYPELWSRMEEKDMIKLVTISHTLFKSHPNLLDASTSDLKLIPVQ